MRLHHIAFGVALICGAFAWAAPTSWDRHAALAIVACGWLLVGLVLATGSAALDVLHPARNERRNARRLTRDLDRAFNAGRDSGLGPSERTLARWRREGFSERGIGR